MVTVLKIAGSIEQVVRRVLPRWKSSGDRFGHAADQDIADQRHEQRRRRDDRRQPRRGRVRNERPRDRAAIGRAARFPFSLVSITPSPSLRAPRTQKVDDAARTRTAPTAVAISASRCMPRGVAHLQDDVRRQRPRAFRGCPRASRGWLPATIDDRRRLADGAAHAQDDRRPSRRTSPPGKTTRNTLRSCARAQRPDCAFVVALRHGADRRLAPRR